jgi:hypothetical protein
MDSKKKSKEDPKNILPVRPLISKEFDLLNACAQGDLDKVYQLIWENIDTNYKDPKTGMTYECN